jgi:hypothetical protein
VGYVLGYRDFLWSFAGELLGSGGAGDFTDRRRDTRSTCGFDKSFEFLLVHFGNVFAEDFVEWNVGI